MSKSPTTNPLAAEVSGQHAQIGVVVQTAAEHTAHPDAQWFANAGLGLFIHWGISSVTGDADLSWGMMARRPDSRAEACERYGAQAVQKTFTPQAYWEQAREFRPRRYEPGRWLEAAKRAGCRYAVLTTKHHDGYTLWPSQWSELGTHTHLGGRDLVADYVKACREHGLKVGFYYSPPDWFFERNRMSFHYGDAKPDLDTLHQPTVLKGRPIGTKIGELHEEQRAHDDHFRRRTRGQVEELLTRYGQIDLLWFDGHGQDSISLERIRELQPGIVVNPRAHGHGDYLTFECAFPKQRPSEWWEYCHLWGDGAWGYLRHEIYKPAGWMLSELAKTRAWGGNFLPNVGPNAEGELPEACYRRLAEVADWMVHSGEAVHDVRPGPWPERANVPVTIRGNVWYLHALLTSPNRLEVRDVPVPLSVNLLRTGAPLVWSREGDVLVVMLPTDLRSTLVDVVKVVWSAPPAEAPVSP